MKKLYFIPASIVLLASTFVIGCGGPDFDDRVESIVAPHAFSIGIWEWKTAAQAAKQAFTPEKEKPAGGDEAFVRSYFDRIGQKTLDEENQKLLTPAVESILKKQVREILNELGIYNPIVDEEFGFPPLAFKLEELPTLLVISPRDKIESMREILLQPGIAVEDRQVIEAGVDKLGVSSLVDDIGGIATYPSLIDSGASLRFTLETIAHEWVHQYLAFTPLGFRYLLDITGISRNYDIATINESLADIAGKEIGDVVYRKYYSGSSKTVTQPSGSPEFNTLMREIRKTVDALLARGEIDQAEAYMEQQRQVLASKGYYIRKLNQAYFAFHGTYADSPAFLNPIGLELKELRAKSPSLKDFLNTTSRMTGPQDLTNAFK